MHWFIFYIWDKVNERDNKYISDLLVTIIGILGERPVYRDMLDWAKLWNNPSWDTVGIELMASQLDPNFTRVLKV